MSRLETKSFAFEIKDASDDSGCFEGLGACFNNIDNGRDLISPGAYTKHLGQFRMDGKVRDEHSVTTGKILDAAETPQGLYIKGQVVNTTAGVDQLKLLRAGVITRLSVGHYVVGRPQYLEGPDEVKSFWQKSGYQPTDQDMERASAGGIRLIQEARPVEISSTYNPMNDKCMITSVKSAGQPAGLTFADHSDHTLAVLEEFQDRATRLFARRQADGRTLSAKHVSAFRRMGDRLATLIEAMDSHETKGAVPYQETPIVSDAWDAGAARKALKAWAGDDMAKYRKGFAWYDASKPEDVGSYKLPIRDIHEGKLVTNIHAVSAALAALDGARGTGVDIPEADKARVKAVLDRYRKEAGVGDDKDKDKDKKSDDAPETKAVEVPEVKGDDAPQAGPATTPVDDPPATTPGPEAKSSTPPTEADPVTEPIPAPAAETPAEAPAPSTIDATHFFAEFEATLASFSRRSL